MPAPELNDTSLLILADLGVSQERTKTRINTLQEGSTPRCFTGPPASLHALAEAGLVEIRNTAGGYKVEITDKGLALHRHCMALMRLAATEQPLPAPSAISHLPSA